MFDDLIGTQLGWHTLEYNWRDSALYALAVGADEDDLLYTYEKNMKAIPSFVATPYYNAVNVQPKQPRPYPVNYAITDMISKKLGHKVVPGFHMGFQIEMKKPIDPIKGTLVFNGYLDKYFDRGPGKGLDIEVKQDIYDEAGNLVAVNTSYHRLKGEGIDGFGGPAPTKKVVDYPDREPDVVIDSYITKTQNVLYRLTGDINLSHVDPDVAMAQTGHGVFMQGLSSLGFATRMAIKAMIPGEPERMKRIYVQMRNMAYPDTPVQLHVWKTSDHSAVFRYMDMKSGKPILDNCEFEWD